jgi:recombination protein RecT
MSNSNSELSNKLVAQGASIKPSSFVGIMKPWYENRQQNIADLCGSAEDAKRLYVAAMSYISNRPELMKCEPKSLQQCIMQSATLNLHPGVLNEADYLCFKGKATFVCGYQGLIKLAIQSGIVSDISSNVVYAADVFDYQEGSNAFIKHKKFLGSRKDRGERVCVYAIANMVAGGVKFVLLTPEEVLSIKNKSMAKNSSYSPWNSDVDNEDEMWKKTAIKRLSKLLPKSTKALNFAKAVALDNAAESPDDKDASLLMPVFDESEFLEE